MPNEPNAVHRARGTLSRTPDLARLAAARARERGWRTLTTLSVDARELRQVVLLPERPHPVVLCARVRAAAAPGSAWEAAARREARSEHVVGVLAGLPPDGSVETDRSGTVEFLMLEHAQGGTLSALLDRRRMVRADEAATILIGTASGLGALHEAGWAVGGLTADGIAFRPDGCPAVDGLRDARPLTDADALSDRRAYRAIAERLCTLVPSPGGWRLLDAVDAALSVPAPHAGSNAGPWERAISGVLAVVEPGVVRLGEDVDAAGATAAGIGAAGMRAMGGAAREVGAHGAGAAVESHAESAPVVGLGAGGEGSRTPRRTHGELVAAGLRVAADHARRSAVRRDQQRRPETDLGGAETLPHRSAASALSPLSAYEPVAAVTDVLLDGRPVAHVTGRLRAWLAVRKKLVAVAVAPVVAIGAVLVLLPGPADADGAGAASDAVGAGGASGTRSGAPAARTGSGRSGPAPEDERTSSPSSSPSSSSSSPSSPPSSSPPGVPGAAGAPVGGEPVEAAPVLLRARHACFAAKAREAACLNDIVQAGSPLAESDRAALDGAVLAEGFDYAGAAVELMQRWGDAALVSVAPDRARTPKSEPASLLMVRSEAGWRLREVFP
ncbi:hypothetical protein ASE16_14460 [Leifsonia sp. Root227]|uniref:hypothetical protein n=1 Tax=Leifsonia sp. Root227 TaxID=1736496 RepID=UPI0006FC0BA4|nr:hypothetical protein [Leifsonia sp. Root227]KRC49874.1 hypothetical protein ASE16_14460 [Leifsonia sp. Root227]